MKDGTNTWVTKSTAKVYENQWITVHEHQVLNPAGGPGIYGTVHMKNMAIGIIPIDEEGNTWLIGQWRFSLNEYSWEIPMGGGPIGEDILDSAKRELKEEAGLTATHWERIIKLHTSNSVTDEVGYVFIATGLTEGETEFEDTEDLKVWKLPFEQAYQMVLDSRITDSLSVAGILRAKSMLL